MDYGGVNQTTVQPIVPDYAGANVRGIVPALLGPGHWSTSLPEMVCSCPQSSVALAYRKTCTSPASVCSTGPSPRSMTGSPPMAPLTTLCSTLLPLPKRRV